MKIGVLALQGAFAEHEAMLEKLGASVCEIRRLSQFTEDIEGLVLPGGESTVQGKLLREEGLYEPIKAAIKNGLPVFGTCAGMILLAKKIYGDDTVHLGLLNATVKRNAYGRQLASFVTEGEFKGIGSVPMTFIRAPYFESVESGVEVLSVVDGNIVAVRQGNILATSFHPECTDDLRVHEYFLNMVKDRTRS